MKKNFLRFGCFALGCVMAVGIASCTQPAKNAVSAGTANYVRTYQTGNVAFKNSATFKVELAEETAQMQTYVASGEPSVITAAEAAIINCTCYVEGKEYVVLFLDLEKNQILQYDWFATENDESQYNSVFYARSEDKTKGLSPFRVTFEDYEKPYLKFDNIRGKICVIDFTSFFD